jgi:hypothetical protein
LHLITGTLETVTVTVVPTYPTASLTGLPRRYDIEGHPAGGFTATLALCYTASDLAAAGIGQEQESQLRLYRHAGGGQWISYTASLVHTPTRVISATITGLSIWAIGLPANEPTAVSLRGARAAAQVAAAWLAVGGLGLLAGAAIARARRRRRR